MTVTVSQTQSITTMIMMAYQMTLIQTSLIMIMTELMMQKITTTMVMELMTKKKLLMETQTPISMITTMTVYPTM